MPKSRGYTVVRDTPTWHRAEICMKTPDSQILPNPCSGLMRGTGPVLKKGMTLAIWTMVNIGGGKQKLIVNGWTVRTRDGSLSAHFEDTIAITMAKLRYLPVFKQGDYDKERDYWGWRSGGRVSTECDCSGWNGNGHKSTGTYFRENEGPIILEYYRVIGYCSIIELSPYDLTRADNPTGLNKEVKMKVGSSVKPRCDKCKVIRRHGVCQGYLY